MCQSDRKENERLYQNKESYIHRGDREGEGEEGKRKREGGTS